MDTKHARPLGDATATLNREHSVSTLIKNGGWDTDLITTSFNLYIAGEILKIPLDNAGVRDSFFWKYDAKGRYTVRDGCRLQRGLFIPPTHQSVHPNEDCLCNFSIDFTSHALFFCAAIKHLWKNPMFTPVLRGGSHSCTLELCLWLKEQLSKADFENFATHTWTVWREKQNAIHREKNMAAKVSWSISLLSDFHKAKNKEQLVVIPLKGNPEKIWTPPRHCSFKLNVDAAVDEKRHHFSIGGVVVTIRAFVVGVWETKKPTIISRTWRIVAIQEEILLIYDKGFTNVQVASDSLLAMQAVTTDQEDLGYIGLCATAIRERLKRPAIFDCIHVYRSSNKVAPILLVLLFLRLHLLFD
ncbi:uncharacterized protein [Primulina eburnea]|uniref:uncharacterized protein n=1 Tax=Primulina eburnea TaxID=1245227 RepID=UPI003C6C8AB1